MRILLIIISTMAITATITWLAALAYRDEMYAKVLWARCPQLIIDPHHPEVSYIDTLTGHVPIRPRAQKN